MPISPAPRTPVTRDLSLLIALRLEDQPMALHDFDEDAATVEAIDHIECIDVSDPDSPIIYTASGACFVVRIFREG